jgi:hypothetical protein
MQVEEIAMDRTTRVQWSESRCVGGGVYERFFMIAERAGRNWTYYERSSWDTCWAEVVPRPGFAAMVIALKGKHAFSEVRRRPPEYIMPRIPRADPMTCTRVQKQRASSLRCRKREHVARDGLLRPLCASATGTPVAPRAEPNDEDADDVAAESTSTLACAN